MPAPLLLARRPGPALAPYLASVIAYAEAGRVPPQREVASLDLPVIVCLSGSFRIALDRSPGAGDRIASFAAGLHPGFVEIESDGDAACVQLNFTPLGARLALGLPMDALAGRLVPLDDLPSLGLADPLAARAAWPDRLAFAEAWAAARIRAGLAVQGPEARTANAAYRLLARSHGAARIGALADRVGWSRKRLAARFRQEFGLAPKPIARIHRFRRAQALAARGAPDWADIAAACGYADQPHLVREFRALAGRTPAAWAAARA
jgi:AraC-like DNA-binding protein